MEKQPSKTSLTYLSFIHEIIKGVIEKETKDVANKKKKVMEASKSLPLNLLIFFFAIYCCIRPHQAFGYYIFTFIFLWIIKQFFILPWTKKIALEKIQGIDCSFAVWMHEFYFHDTLVYVDSKTSVETDHFIHTTEFNSLKESLISIESSVVEDVSLPLRSKLKIIRMFVSVFTLGFILFIAWSMYSSDTPNYWIIAPLIFIFCCERSFWDEIKELL